MATNNVSAPFGFRQYAGNGSAPTYEQVSFPITAGANAIYFGDPVTAQSDGSVAQSASTGATPAALGIAGVFVGCKFLSAVQKRVVWSNYYPGGTDPQANTIVAYIVNDPNAKFVVQSDSTGIALTDINSTIGFLIGSGNTSSGISGAYLDTSTINTSSYLQNNPFKIVAVVTDPPGSQGTISNGTTGGTSGQGYDYAIVMFNNEFTRNFQGV
jgi:hypothetical protein